MSKKLDDAFLTKKAKNNKAIEGSVYKHIMNIDDTDDAFEIHKNILNVLEISSLKDSKYFDWENFKVLLNEMKFKKNEAIRKAKERKKEKK